MPTETGDYWDPDFDWGRSEHYDLDEVCAGLRRANAWRDMHYDNIQRMLDPVSPFDFMYAGVSPQWLRSCVKLGCDIAL